MQRNFYIQDRIGRARHCVSFHDGVKTHNDGSRFYDMKICGNKRNRDRFLAQLRREGYVERSAIPGVS